MSNENNNLDNQDLIKEYKQRVKNKVFLWFLKQRLFIKIFIIIIVSGILLFLAWIGYFGDKNKKLVDILCPAKDSVITTPEPPDIDSLIRILDTKKDSALKDLENKNRINLIDTTFSLRDRFNNDWVNCQASIFQINDLFRFLNSMILNKSSIQLFEYQIPSLFLQENIKRSRILVQLTFKINGKEGRNKELCKAGDELELYLTLDKKCFVALASIDANDVFLLNSHKSSELFEPVTNAMVGKYILNSTEGFEAYYAIVSYDTIKNEVILPQLKMMHGLIKDLQFKGPSEPFSLNLSKDFYQDHIYFYSNWNESKK